MPAWTLKSDDKLSLDLIVGRIGRGVTFRAGVHHTSYRLVLKGAYRTIRTNDIISLKN